MVVAAALVVGMTEPVRRAAFSSGVMTDLTLGTFPVHLDAAILSLKAFDCSTTL